MRGYSPRAKKKEAGSEIWTRHYSHRPFYHYSNPRLLPSPALRGDVPRARGRAIQGRDTRGPFVEGIMLGFIIAYKMNQTEKKKEVKEVWLNWH
jgi:hypothetical protein